MTHDPTTPGGRAALRAVMAAGTPTPWTVPVQDDDVGPMPDAIPTPGPWCLANALYAEVVGSDADKIVAAVNAIEPALARIEALKRERDALRAQLANRGTDGAPRVDQRDALLAKLRAACEGEGV